MAEYRHHEGQMRPHELTMGQIQGREAPRPARRSRCDPTATRPRPAISTQCWRGRTTSSATSQAPDGTPFARSVPDAPGLEMARRVGDLVPRMRIALLTEIPAPFRVPLFNALADETASSSRSFFLAEATRGDRTTALHGDEIRFPYRILRGRELRRAGGGSS